MANIRLEKINKFFSGGVLALKNITMEIEDKEFLVVVGPSGSGKTTFLRILAGLENPSSGDVFIDGQKVTNKPTSERDIAMVFQSYSLYPHLNVQENLSLALENSAYTEKEKEVRYLTMSFVYGILASFLILFSILISLASSNIFQVFSLVMLWFFFFMILSFRKVRSEIERRVLKLISERNLSAKNYLEKEKKISEQISLTAKLLGIQDLLKRKPDQLSGGQRQRVALGRAILRKPKAFLMDEPLSNLDAKLRSTMRLEIAELQRNLQITTVYVTHDQIEAMTLGNRIIVLNNGEIEQIGSSTEIYSEPKNVFVASFFGNPQMNLIPGRLEIDQNQFVFKYSEHNSIILQGVFENTVCDINENVILGIRPESFRLLKNNEPNSENNKKPIIKGKIVHLESLGASKNVHIEIDSKMRLVVSAETNQKFEVGSELAVEVPQSKMYFFDAETGLRIKKYSCKEFPSD